MLITEYLHTMQSDQNKSHYHLSHHTKGSLPPFTYPQYPFPLLTTTLLYLRVLLCSFVLCFQAPHISEIIWLKFFKLVKFEYDLLFYPFLFPCDRKTFPSLVCVQLSFLAQSVNYLPLVKTLGNTFFNFYNLIALIGLKLTFFDQVNKLGKVVFNILLHCAIHFQFGKMNAYTSSH